MRPDRLGIAGRLASIVAAAVLAGSVLAQSTRADEYLPLAVGARWELRSQTSPTPMVLEVTGREADSFVVRWDNPWVKATFRFRLEGSDVMLAALDMGQGVTPMPTGTVYFSFADGSRKSAVGTTTVRSRNERVSANGTEYRDCIEIETKDNKNQSMFWTFARGVGFVRFGRGKEAFVLSSVRPGAAQPSVSSRERPAAGATVAPAAAGGHGHVLVGLDANPPESAGSDDRAKREWLEKSLDAGATLIYVSPTWADLERSEGQYTFDEVDRESDAAARRGLALALNLRIVDTNNRSVPKPYEKWSFGDGRLADRVIAALTAIAPRTKGRVRWLEIGNEVDGYFGAHASELPDYVTLLDRVIPEARRLFPGAGFSVSFTAGATGQLDRFAALTRLFDYYAFTYYPLNADFTMRPPGDAASDIARLVEAAGAKPVLIQELGYASSPRLKSSEEQQAAFVRNAFAAIASHQDRIVGANFLFMSDLPNAVVETLGRYYRAANSDNFKAYLATLGFFRGDGKAKPAWEAFQSEARKLAGAR